MKRTLRVLSITLAVAMILFVTMLGVMAAVTSTAVVYGDAVNLSGNENSTFDVRFHFKNNNTDVEAGKINLTWNAAKATVTEIVADDGLAGADVKTSVDNENGTAVVAWAGSSIGESVKTGDLFTVTFQKGTMTEEDTLTVDVDVESFGYTALFVPYNLADSVTANAGYASTGDTVTIAEGDNIVEKLNLAVEKAALGDVEVTLNTTWTLTENVTIGDVDSIPSGVISVTGTGGINTAGFVAHLAGHFEFGEITLTGTGANNSNALFAPNGASITINSTVVTSTTDTEQINVAGSKVVVNGGNYQYVVGNIAGTDYGLSSTDITVQGATKLYYLVGGSYNRTAAASLTGDSKSYVGGSVSITGYCVNGSWYAGNTTHGGTMTIETTGTIAQVVAGSAGNTTPEDKNVENQYVLTIKSGTFSSHVASSIFVADSNSTAHYNTIINIQGGNFTGDVYGGATHGWGTARKFASNGVSVLNISGGTFAKPIFGGSDMSKAGSNSTQDCTINVSNCTLNVPLYGGSEITVADLAHNGTTTITLDNAIVQGELVGGSLLAADGAENHASATINLKNGSALVHPDYDADDTTKRTNGYSVFGGSYFTHPNGVHSGNTVINMFVDEDSEAAYSFDSSQTVYGGSRMVTSSTSGYNATNASHTGMIEINVDKALLTNVYGAWAAITGGCHVSASGAQVNIANTTEKKAIEINITNSEVTARVLGACYIGGSGGTIDADVAVNIGEGNTFGNAVYGGAYLGVSSGKHVGDTHIVLDLDSSEMNRMVYGGSFVAKDGAEHQGNTEVEILSGSVSNSIMGGSHLYVCGAVHRGNSYIETSGTLTGNIYGGSYLIEAGTKHIGNSEAKMLGGSTTKSLYGGSCFPAADGNTWTEADGEWGHLGGSGIVVESGTLTGSYHFGGSNMNVNAASIQSGYGVHGVRYQAATADTPEVKASNTYVTITGGTITGYAVYGGAYMGKVGTTMYGDITMKISGGTLNLRERIAGAYAVNGTADNPNNIYGNASLTITGDAVIAGRTMSGTAYVPSIIAGLYGTAYLHGDTYLEISGNASVVSTKTDSGDIIAGNYGTNNIDTTTTDKNKTNPYGGTRQTGNVTFVAGGSAVMGQRVSVIGMKNVITGDVTIDISGSPTFKNNFYGNLRSSNQTSNYYGSCYGDMRIYIAGTPTFDLNFWGVGTAGSTPNGPNNGTNVCVGVCYIEVSGNPTFKNGHFYGGTFGASGGTIFKFIGDSGFNMVTSGTYVWFHQYKAGYLASGDPSIRIIDLTQYTGELTASGLPACMSEDPCRNNDSASGYTFTVWEPLKDKNVTFGTNELTAGTAMSSLVTGQNVTIGGTTVAYDDLIAYDDLSKSPNAFKFYSAEQDKEITTAGAATHDIYVTAGADDYAVRSGVIHFENTALDATVNAVKADFGFKGNSIRTYGSLALRCRAFISEKFLKAHTDKTNGYMIKEIGILVAASDDYSTAELVVGGTGVVAAKAWENGVLNEMMSGGKWMIDENDPGNYYFAAAVSKYTAERYNRNVYFRPYVIVEDANGDTFVAYRDLAEYVTDENDQPVTETTATESGATLIVGDGFTQYTTSLYNRADYEKTANTSFYKANTVAIDEIIAAVEG